MKKNTAKNFLKCFHIVLSLLIISAAVFILGFMWLMKPKFSTYSTYLYDYSSIPALFLIVGSALAVAVTIFGIISAWMEWIRGIVIFTLFILYLLVSMIALTITAHVLSPAVDEKMHFRLKKDMGNYESNKKIVDHLQSQLSCCGVNNFTDWDGFLSYIPGSCCQSPAFCDNSEVSKLHLSGCYPALRDIVYNAVTIIFIVLVGLAIVEICSMINSIFLVAYLRRAKNGGNDSMSESIGLSPIHNPLGQNGTPTITVTTPGGSANGRPEPVYVRRPIERPIILGYKSPHEDYLHRPPQYRFDSRRISFINRKPGKQTPYVYDSSRYS